MPLLEVKNLTVMYGPVGGVRDFDFQADSGKITLILGGNGAGKSSSLKAVSGLVKPVSGQILFKNQDISNLSVQQRVKSGIAHVLQERRLFGDQTVMENLRLGAYLRIKAGDKNVEADIEEILTRFPVLGEKRNHLASTLSGGQQQLLCLGIALMSKPSLVMLDEPALGLAPKIIEETYNAVYELKSQGMALLIVEHNVFLALQYADYAYVLRQGRLLRHGPAEEIRKELIDGDLRTAFF